MHAQVARWAASRVSGYAGRSRISEAGSYRLRQISRVSRWRSALRQSAIALPSGYGSEPVRRSPRMASRVPTAPTLQNLARPPALLHGDRSSKLTILSFWLPVLARIAGCIHSSGINTFVVVRSSASAAIWMTSCMPYSSNEFTKCRSQANTFGFIGWGVRV